MRLSAPRIPPLTDAEMTPEQREALEPLRRSVAGQDRPEPLNIFKTMIRAPEAFKRFNQWGGYILSRHNGLTPREREIVILRTGFNCRSGYEFTQHTRIGLDAGLSEDEIGQIKAGADAGWSPKEAALIRMADDLTRDFFVSDAVWAELDKHFDQKACMDAVFTAGQYTQVSMFLNSFGVQLDPGQALDPDLKV